MDCAGAGAVSCCHCAYRTTDGARTYLPLSPTYQTRLIISPTNALMSALPGPPLTAEQVAEIRQAIAEFEEEGPSDWIDHEEAMHIFDEDEPVHDDR
jgi:hypothetical protein